MRLLEHKLESLDGSEAKLVCYLMDNSPEIDPNRVRPCAVVVPGGGYQMTSDREAEPVAIRMLSYGYQAFVLRYSVQPSTYPTALHELAQAMTLIREHAHEWHIDPDEIFVAGFSAGGHLVADLGIEWNGDLLAGYGFDAEQIKPNGLMLGYSVLSSGEFAHRPSFDRLLGEKREDADALDEVCIEKHVTDQFPPTFLFHTMTDMTVPMENSLLLLAALRRAGVLVEAHFFPAGRHGVSLGNRETMYADCTGIEASLQIWPDMFHRWVDDLVDIRRAQKTEGAAD